MCVHLLFYVPSFIDLLIDLSLASSRKLRAISRSPVAAYAATTSEHLRLVVGYNLFGLRFNELLLSRLLRATAFCSECISVPGQWLCALCILLGFGSGIKKPDSNLSCWLCAREMIFSKLVSSLQTETWFAVLWALSILGGWEFEVIARFALLLMQVDCLRGGDDIPSLFLFTEEHRKRLSI